MKRSVISLLLATLLFVSRLSAQSPWQSLAPGLEWGTFHANAATPVGDATLTVLRIDPQLWELKALSISETGDAQGMTARQWCERHPLVAATNAGMFMTDYRTHVGIMKNRRHTNAARFNGYQSVAAFDPVSDSLPPFRIFDLDEHEQADIERDYRGLVQNLRLIKKPGINRWGQQPKKWSEAALGEDKDGNILFIFARSPYSMRDFNQLLLGLPIGLVAAQHLEGGPEAQLYFQFGTTSFEGFGSYETGFYESDANDRAWAVPNVLGIGRR
jgi:hypothetical protein